MTVSDMTQSTAVCASALEAKLFSHPWSERDFMMSLHDPSRRFFVCTDGDRLIGYCGLQAAGGQGDVLTIGVDPDFRRRGAGLLLLRRLIEEARIRGVERLFLEVRASNTAARRLYERAGFSAEGCRKGYYRDPDEDGLIYILEVPS